MGFDHRFGHRSGSDTLKLRRNDGEQSFKCYVVYFLKLNHLKSKTCIPAAVQQFCHKCIFPRHNGQNKVSFIFCKGSFKNKFTELALRFRLKLYDPIEQSRRNSKLFRGLCVMRIVQIQPEAEMQKCEVIFE